MSPQPLNRVKPVRTIEMYPEALDKCPALAGKVMRIIGTWSAIESEFFRLAASFLRADFQIVTTMLLEVTSNEGRRAAIRAAAEHALSGGDLAVFKAIDDLAKACRDRRNEFAHYVWGWSEELPDALLLFEPPYLAQHTAAVLAYYHKYDPFRTGDGLLAIGAIASGDPEWPRLDHSKVMVYREADLSADLARFEHVLQLVTRFHLALRDDRLRARLLPELRNELGI